MSKSGPALYGKVSRKLKRMFSKHWVTIFSKHYSNRSNPQPKTNTCTSLYINTIPCTDLYRVYRSNSSVNIHIQTNRCFKKGMLSNCNKPSLKHGGKLAPSHYLWPINNDTLIYCIFPQTFRYRHLWTLESVVTTWHYTCKLHSE